MYKLMNSNGEFYLSETPGTFGGYNGNVKIYGALDCPSALMWIKKGFYIKRRVFFKNEQDAVLAGFRPCAVCQKEKYLKWKANPQTFEKEILNIQNEENEK